ncbi:tyrosine-type recombinase/integrase [Thermonema rossianum]
MISQAEIEAMLLCANSLKQRCIILFLYGTGIRLKELIELKIDDIDFKKQELHIQSGSYPRSVPIPKKAINDLIRYCQTYLPKKYLFENQKHERCSARSIQKSIKAAAAKAGVRKEVSPRLLRYSFAIHLLRYGISPQYVKQLLGITSLNSLFCYNPYAPSNFVRPPSPLDIETIEVNSHN